MSQILRKIYEFHHKGHRKQGFSVLKDERGELLKKIIGEKKKILDLGCRDGALTQYFLQNNEVWGVDIDKISLTRAEKLGIKTVLMDLNHDWFKLKDLKFDVIIAGEVLEHLYFPECVLKRIVNCLKQDGLFLGSVPNAFSLKNRIRYLFAQKKFTPLGDPTHINHFSYKELEQILKKYFGEVKIMGFGKHQLLVKLNPNLFAFDLFFLCSRYLL